MIAFFDLDKTLIDVNSGHLWVRHEWRAGRMTVGVGLRAIYWFGRYALGDASMGVALDEAASLYAGVPDEEVDRTVRAWFHDEVAHRLRPGAAEALKAHRQAGDHLVLATSSSHFAARAAAEVFGLDDVVCTELETRDGRLTGRITRTGFGEGKREQVEAWAHSRGLSLDDAAFYTDSYTDLPVLERVGRPVVVHPDRRLRQEARRQGWPVEDWGSAG